MPHLTMRDIRIRFASEVQEAESILLTSGCVIPAFIVTTHGGEQVRVTADFGSPEAKQRSRDAVRLLSIAKDAAMVVHRTETWLVLGAPPPEGVAVSQSDRRIEALLVVLEGRVGREMRQLSCLREIVRGQDGRPIGLTDLAIQNSGEMSLVGPMAELLPPRRPDANLRALARAVLEQIGDTLTVA